MNNRGRFQAQGNHLQKSQPWETDDDISKTGGNNLITELQDQLTNSELNERENALEKARQFVNQAPSAGYNVIGLPLIVKTFPDSPINRSIRVDAEIRAGIAFIDD